MTDLVLAPEWLLPAAFPERLTAGTAVRVRDSKILATGTVDALEAQYGPAPVRQLSGCLLMAGFVNAHQHGRGVSQIQLGYADDFLETWIAARRARGVLDAYAVTRLAALRMAANGITTAIHANYSYASGDYEAEVRAQIRAYLEVGLRVTMAIGAMDRGAIAYPPHEACFCAGLPPALSQWLGGSGPPAYMKDAAATLDLMRRLRAEYGGEERVNLCYGPAGPQWVSDELWRALADDANRLGVGLHLHALESPAQRDALRELYPEGVFRRLAALGAMNERTVLAHGVWLGERELDDIAGARAIVVRNPGSNLRLRNGIAPLAAMLARGIRVAIGTDNAACDDSEDLLGELRMADLLARAPHWNALPPPRPQDLLAMITTSGAAAAGLDGRCGRIEPGMLADLVGVRLDGVCRPYLDDDMPLPSALLARAKGADVCLTMVGGRAIFDEGRFADCDAAAVEESAARAARAARLPADREAPGRTRALREALAAHYRSRTAAAGTRDDSPPQ